MLYNIYYIYIGWLMGYIYIYINIFPKKLQFTAYGQFVLVYLIKLLLLESNQRDYLCWLTIAKLVAVKDQKNPTPQFVFFSSSSF